MNYWFLFIPVISAIIGWAGSWVAGKILLFKVIPKHRQGIAEKIGAIVSAEFPFSSIEEKIMDPATIKKIMPLVEEHIDDFLRNKLKEKMPVISMFIGDKTINSLKEVFLKEIENIFPQVLKRFAGDLQSKLNIGELVTEKVKGIPAPQLENLFGPVLKYFRFTGAATGFVIGLINMIFFYILR
ncbi:MAG: DUF445 domain-containing protein [Bacteroidota bacterium]|nr:DUF445 domain-containing protein [Bacteroidota bacterium]